MAEIAAKRTLREWRETRNLKPVQLAAQSDVSLTTVVEIEGNRRIPNMSTAEKLADTLGVTIADIRWPKPEELISRRTKQSADGGSEA